MIAYFNSEITGDGTEDNPYRPKIGDAPGISKWETAPLDSKTMLVRVYADESTIATLAKDFKSEEADVDSLRQLVLDNAKIDCSDWLCCT